jgi:hypothetical protein
MIVAIKMNKANPFYQEAVLFQYNSGIGQGLTCSSLNEAIFLRALNHFFPNFSPEHEEMSEELMDSIDDNLAFAFLVVREYPIAPTESGIMDDYILTFHLFQD